MQGAARLWKQLDDLAANDPKGYKDFMSSQSSQLKELSKELEFIPDVGFVIETELRSGISIGQTCTGRSLPFFVNVCQSDKLRAPTDISLGKRKVKKDKIIIDVVAQKERVQKAKPNIPAKTALANDILARILPLENKHGPASFGPISFPALLYKGGRKADPHVIAPLSDHGVVNSLQSGEMLLTKGEPTPADLLNGSGSTKVANSSSLITEISSTTFDEEEVKSADAQTSNPLITGVKTSTSSLMTDRAVSKARTIVTGNATKNSFLTEVTTRKICEKASVQSTGSDGVAPHVPSGKQNNSSSYSKIIDETPARSKLTNEIPAKSSKLIEEVPAHSSKPIREVPVKSSKLIEEVPAHSPKLIEEVPAHSSKLIEEVPAHSPKLIEERSAHSSKLIEEIPVNDSNPTEEISSKSPQDISLDQPATATTVRAVASNCSHADVRSCSRNATSVPCENRSEPQGIVDGSADMCQNHPSWIEDITSNDSSVILHFPPHVPRAEVSLFTSDVSALLSYRNDSFTVQFAPSHAKWDKKNHCLILKRQLTER